MATADKAKKLESQLSSHFDTAKELATIINEQLPEEKQLGVPEMDRRASIKDNTSKLVQFVQTIRNFVEEFDRSLKDNLSREQYTKVALVMATMEQILAIVKTVTKGLVATTGPIVATIAKKLKNSKVLHKLEKKLGAVHRSRVIHAMHESHATKGRIGESHPGIPENEDELDHTLKSLETEDSPDDFSTEVRNLVQWYSAANKAHTKLTGTNSSS